MVIAVANQKGGVGKTTTAVNVSSALAQLGKRVLLVDADPQGNATSGVGIDKKASKVSVYDVLVNGTPVEKAVVETEFERLYLMPSNIDLVGAEIELVSVMLRETVFARAIEPIRESYDYIIIDCPPSLGLITLNMLSAADKLLIPIQCEYYALEGLGQLVNTVHLVRQHLNKGLEIEGAIPTMYDGRTNLSAQVVEEVKGYFGSKVHTMPIPRNVRLGEAPSHGKPINYYDPKCVGADAYRQLALEIAEGF